MHALSLLLLALPWPQDHARLHPVDADVYLEIPQVQEALEALETAPLVRTIDDPAVQDLLGSLGQTYRLHPTDSLIELLSAVAPGADWKPVVREVRGVSISLGWPDDSPRPDAGLVVELATPVAAQLLQASVLSNAKVLGPLEDVELENAQRWECPAATAGEARWNVALMQGLQFWSAVDGSRFLCGTGRTTAVGFVERMAQDGRGAESSPLWAGAAKRLGDGEGLRLVTAVMNRSVADLLASAARAQGETLPALPPLVAELIDGRFFARMEMRGKRFVTETYTPLEENAAAALLGGQDIDPSWLSGVSTDNMAALMTSVNAAQIASQVRAFLAPLGDAQEEIAAFEEELGFSLDELFGHLGPNMLGTMDGLSGIGLPKTFAWVEVRDATLFSERMTSFLESAGTRLPGLAAKSRDYKFRNAAGDRVAYPVTTLTLPPEFNMVPMLGLSPAYTLVEGRLLFGLNSMHVKRELKRLFGAKASEASGSDPFAARGIELQEGTRTAVIMDWGMLVTGVLDLARALGGMAGDSLPFDPDSLPQGEMLTKHFEPTFHVARRVEGGLVRTHVSSFGPEVLLGAQVLALQLSAPPESGSAVMEAEPVEPAGSGGRVR